MAGAGRYRIVRAWARAQVVTGVLVMTLGGLAALAVFAAWPADLFALVPGSWRALLGPPAAVAVLLVANIVGGSLVLSGQRLLLLRDIHRHLARMDARDKRRALERDASPRPPDATARLLPRR